METSGRKVYMDFLRIVACFWVIFNHLPGYFAYEEGTTAGLTFYYLFFTMVAKINVPIFFMLTGALLLPRKTTYKELFTKRIPRMLSALLIASLLYYIAHNKNDLSVISVFDFVKKVIIDDLAGAFWYLYAYIGLLLMLPFLQRMARDFTTADFILLLSVQFVLSAVIPVVNHILGLMGLPAFWYTPSFSIPIFTTQSLFYPLVGYYLEHVLDIHRITRKHLCFMTLASCLGIFTASYLTYYEGITYGFTQNYVLTFNYILAINFFILIKYLFTKYHGLNKIRVLPFLSSLTFGIYLMEPILRCLDKETYFDPIVPLSLPILHTFVWCLFSMGLCGFLTYLLKKVPIAAKLL